MQTYMTRPMHVMGFAGLAAMFLGVLCLVATVIVKLVDGTSMIRNPLLHLRVEPDVVGAGRLSPGDLHLLFLLEQLVAVTAGDE